MPYIVVTGMPAVTGVAELIVRRAEDDHIGLRYESDSWSWREVVRECAQRAALLDSLRRPGEFHVGVLLDNVPEYIFLLGGAALAGATVVGINPTRRGGELGRDVRHTDCQIIVTDAAYLPLLEDLDLGMGADRIFAIESEEYRGLVTQHQGAPVPESLPPADALWVLIFTSGSTGAPKAVRVSQARIAAYGTMGLSSDDVLYCAMPLFHGNALSANLVPGLASGATIVLRRKFSASGFLGDIQRYGVTYFNTVGRALSYILAMPPSDHDRDHRVRFALGPESTAPDIAAFRARFGIPVIEGYGSSEGAIRLMPVRSARPGALGIPDPDADVVVMNAETLKECPRARFDADGRLRDGEAIGEIVRRDGVARFEGYYNNDAANAERTRNGWFWSGDLAYRDEEGVFHFAGRNSDWIRVDGENFAAAPIERMIARHPSVAGVAAYGVPDPLAGDQVMAALELVAGRSFDAVAFKEFLDEQPDLGTKWAPRFVRIVAHLPVTVTNKIAKESLRAEAWTAHDPVWWQAERGQPYTLLTPEDAALIEAAFERHGRGSLLEAARRTRGHVRH